MQNESSKFTGKALRIAGAIALVGAIVYLFRPVGLKTADPVAAANAMDAAKSAAPAALAEAPAQSQLADATTQTVALASPPPPPIPSSTTQTVVASASVAALAASKVAAKPLTGKEPYNVDFALLDTTQLPDQGISELMPPAFSPEILQLVGKRIRVKGFMTPYQSLDDMTNFILTPTVVGCFFCNPVKPTQVVLIRQPKDKGPYPYIDEMIEAEGTLKLWKAKSPDDTDLEMFVYILDGATVKKTPLVPAK